MTSGSPTIPSEFDDHSRPNTLLAPQPTSVTHLLDFESPGSLMAEEPFSTSLADTLQLPSPIDGPPQLLLPVPASKSQHIFSLSDLLDETGGLETLGPEIATADINIANDGRFIESSSGPAIYELKRRYDQLAGVGSSVRTPYVITAFVSQHGKAMFRLGHRDETAAPGATAATIEEKIIQSKTPSEASQSPRTKRRSRLSMHFLPPAMFNKNNVTPASRPPTTSSTASRKLRKTRSIPDMSSTGEGEMPAGMLGSTFVVTGRAHSQSVTAVDIPRHKVTFNVMLPGRKTDIFTEVMGWHTPSLAVSSQVSTHSLLSEIAGFQQTRDDQDRPTVLQPFGPGITFNSPSLKSAVDRLPAPRHLREMQSFESGMTARQIDLRSSLSPSDTSVTILDQAPSRPPSAMSMTLTSSDLDSNQTFVDMSKTNVNIDTDIAPSAETQRLTSAHTIEVFNVLQTYRGLPLFEKLVPSSEDVIRLSLAAEETAAPRDDPRFVIWGDAQPEPDVNDYHSTSRDSLTDFSSNPSSSLSRKRSTRASKMKTPEAPSARLPLTEDERVLLAATIERWIAQLTSCLNYDELLNFFLTYRNYVSAIDVCNILICRFHWALQKPSSMQDEAVRRVVRVRTFVAIRYWLLTFFTVDFMPNRELRLLIADWLNTLIHDPLLKAHSDGIGIVRRLVKVAKECKRAHTRVIEKPKTSPQAKAIPDLQEDSAHLLGESFAKAIKKPVVEEEESDLDLDFLPGDANLEEFSSGFPTDPANAHLTTGIKGTALAPSRPIPIPLSSFNILQRTDHAPGLHVGEMSFVQNPTIRHSSLSRAFMKTIGRIGRWKRVLNPKYSTRPTSLGACGTVSAFDLEISAARDMLATHGGVEEYLMMAGPVSSGRAAPQTTPLSHPQLPPTLVLPPMPTTPPPAVPTTAPGLGHVYPVSPGNIQKPLPVTPEVTLSSALEQSSVSSAEPKSAFDAPDSLELHIGASSSSNIRASRVTSYDSQDALVVPERAESFRSSSTDSFGAPLTSGGPLQPSFPGSHSQWKFDVVSIDELDLSDTSSIPGGEDLHHPPGLRKPLRKLPLRRDFEFVRHSEVSSMGIISHESLRDSVSSSHSEASPSSSPGRAPIRRWQMKSLQRTFDSSSDSGDKGDVEDALRRLEGQINPKVLQEKAEKVDGWVRTMQQRMADGDYDDERSILSEEEVESFIDELDPLTSDSDTHDAMVHTEAEGGNVSYAPDNALASGITLVPTQIPSFSSAAETEESSLYSMDPKPAPADVIPSVIFRGGVSAGDTAGVKYVPPTIETVLSSNFSSSETPRIHRSFVHDFPAEVLAEHFAMIDRELFIGVKFEELVSEHWMECEGIDVLDWAQFLKDRTRWKAESRFPERRTALAALWARFNLMVNFVVAEVVLTPPTERPALVDKFIRVAWESYALKNFNTLTAFIVALQDDWVAKAMRRPGWHRIGTFETRMYRDLKQFTANTDDFKFMRQVVESIVDAKPLETNSRSASVVSGGGTDSQSRKSKGSENRPAIPSACIPFIGIYLTKLYRLNKLPAVIDPTAPHQLSALDTVNSIFQSPLHPEVFSSLAPLPPSMSLEVLINVHKQRRIADVIKSLVAGQHLASRVYFEVDKKLFQRCLRLRGLDATYLQRALALYPD